MHSIWLWLALAIAVVVPETAVQAAGPKKPVVTNKQRFRIPFRFDEAALQRMNARELQLLVSQDRGGSWELAQAIAPQSGKFEFQAGTDGEYWFVVRTIDGAGQAHPPGNRLEAGLMVVVDTVAPKLDVQLQPVAGGKVQLSWQASDSNLDANTLRLEFMQPGSIDWQPVSVIPRNSGQTVWTVPQSGLVSVKGSIADLAGNTTQADARAQVTGTGEAIPKPEPPDLRQPIAISDGPATAFNDAVRAPTSAPAQLPIAAPTVAAPAVSAQPTPVRPTLPPSQLIGVPANQRPEITKERWPAVDTAAEAHGFRAGSRTRVVNTRSFQLGYKIDDVGPSGIGGVELFITQDQGRQWYRYGEDADRTSPFDVKVHQDGDYGFAIRARNGAGLSVDPPVPGEAPSIHVVVDETPPALELLSVQQGQGPELNQIQIRWRTSDLHSSDKPIALHYAPSLNGPWEQISGWRQDTGSFQWTVGPGTPPQLYIRVTARDAAGNVSKVDTPAPVLVDLSRPMARIVDVEVTPSARPR